MTRALILLALFLTSCASQRTDNDAAYWSAASKTIGQKIKGK